jgi:YegS/Rv2252/BmrU family lipid kinase
MRQAWCLVVNPAAAGGRSVRLLPAVVGALGASGAPLRVCRTTSLGDAARTAGQAVRRGETVVAVGGDGLVGCVAPAVAEAGGVLGIIPAGRGNDFARTLGVPFGAGPASRALLDGHPRKVDMIAVRAGGGPEQVVVGSVYLGVVSEGGALAAAGRLPGGALGYSLAGMRVLAGWRPATFTVETAPDWPGPDAFPGFTVVVANSAYLAAGKKAAPGADVGDGLLDVITVRHGSKLSFARVMLMAGRGTHVSHPQVGVSRAAEVIVTASRAMPAGADGETLPFAAPLATGTPLRIRALPGALAVITPDGLPHPTALERPALRRRPVRVRRAARSRRPGGARPAPARSQPAGNQPAGKQPAGSPPGGGQAAGAMRSHSQASDSG